MASIELIERELTQSVIGSFYEAYNNLGFGFLEHLHVMALERELRWKGHRVNREVSVPVYYKNEILGTQRIDMIVDAKLIVEVKSTRHLPPGSERQVYNYLKATNLKIGLLLHFGPEAKFYRIVATKCFAVNPPDPLNPPDEVSKTQVHPGG